MLNVTKTLLACALSAAASNVHAATITFTDTIPLQDVEISASVAVPQFNSSLGTLTGISWTLTGAIASIIGVQNDSAGPVTGSAFVRADYLLDSTTLSLGASPDFSLLVSTGVATLGVGESVLFPVTGMQSISGMEAVSAAFIGNSLVEVLVLTLTSFGASGFGGDITISQATDAGFEFVITYEFDETVIPVPAAAPLMAAGLGLFGLYGARRRRRAA
jgi:hypothetical protein